jgi:8-oxo-dGTP pyrophosphatase MutT (NUDIX family)
MYKVFISEKEVSFLSIEHLKKNDFNVCFLEEILGNRYDFLISKLQVNNNLKIVCPNPMVDMMTFFNEFDLVLAAGGIVEREKEFLWIYRNNKWDLPKGKKEINEDIETTAIREVQEECGLGKELSIEKFLISTFHTYSTKDIPILKRTDWFLMNYKGSENLKPQLEEGITKVVWVSSDKSESLSMLSYSSIREVWKSYVL